MSAFLPAGLKDAKDVIFKKVDAKPPSLDLLVAYRRNTESEVVRSFLTIVDEVVSGTKTPTGHKSQKLDHRAIMLRYWTGMTEEP